MGSFWPGSGAITEDDLVRHEAGINRVAWGGGLAVTAVTFSLLLLMLLTQADRAWEYPLYIMLAIVPLSYAGFCNFILRGVQLVGINSVLAPLAARQQAWSRLAVDLEPAKLDAISSETGLDEVPRIAAEIVAGRVRGRVVVDVNR